MKTIRRVKKVGTSVPAKQVDETKPVIDLEAIRKQVLEKSAELIQLSSLRLNLSKREEEMKSAINDIMKSTGLAEATGTVMVDGKNVNVTASMKSSTRQSIDIDKLTGMLTPEQFKQCASVTLKTANEVLPKALIDQCVTVTTSHATVSVSGDKGFPVPEVTLLLITV